MSEDMEKFRHIDGSSSIVDLPYIKIHFQHGSVADNGINGCTIEDVIDALTEKLLDFQGRELACQENATALYHLDLAREALLIRRRRRERQGVLGTHQKHTAE